MADQGLWPVDISSLAESAYRFGNLPSRLAFQPIDDLPTEAAALDASIDAWRARCKTWIGILNRAAEDVTSDPSLFSLIHGVGAPEPFSHIVFTLLSCTSSAQLCGDPVHASWTAHRCHRFLVAVKHVAESIQETSTMVVAAGIRIWKEPFKTQILEIERRRTGRVDTAQPAQQPAAAQQPAQSRPSVAHPSPIPIGFTIERLIETCSNEDARSALLQARERTSGSSDIQRVISELGPDQKRRFRPIFVDALAKIATENAAERMNLPPAVAGMFETISRQMAERVCDELLR